MGLFTTKTRECHNCGYVAEDCDVGYTERFCPYCGTMMLDGDIIQRGSAKLQEEVVFEAHIKGNPKKEALYRERREKTKQDTAEQLERFETEYAQRQAAQASACVPKCPTCGSTDVQLISTASRLGSALLFGLASSKIGKTMECKNCGYKW